MCIDISKYTKNKIKGSRRRGPLNYLKTTLFISYTNKTTKTKYKRLSSSKTLFFDLISNLDPYNSFAFKLVFFCFGSFSQNCKFHKIYVLGEYSYEF